MKPIKPKPHRMRKLVFAGLAAFLICSQAFSQTPTISASQYVITIQSSQPNDYDYLHNVQYSRQYSFYDVTGGLTHTLSGNGPGGYFNQLYVTDAKKPVSLNAQHGLWYQYENCETYNGVNCSDVPVENRQAKNGRTTGKQDSGSRISQIPPCTNCWWVSYSYNPLVLNNIPLRYPTFDTTIYYGSATITISVGSAGDQNFNLPSSDNISIKADGNVSGFTWQYQVLGMTGWTSVPSGLIQAGGTELNLNGQSLFGGSWMSYINKTVVFRLINGSQTTSNVLIYTHRLSSPKIVSVTAVQNPCFGFNQAYIKVTFDRMLLLDERINLFLKDASQGLDYSALNLDNLNLNSSDYSYTWRPELVQGNYKVSLIGKYYEYATYTGSPQHFAFVNIQDPELVRSYLSQQPVLCNGGNSGKVVVAGKGGVGNFKYELVPLDNAFTDNWTSFSNALPNLVNGTMDQTHSGLTSQYYKVRVRDGNNCMNRDSAGNEVVKKVMVAQPAEALHASLLEVSPITAWNLSNGAIKVRLAGGTVFPYSVEVPNYRKYQFEWRDSTTNALITNYTLDQNDKFEINIANLAEGTYTLRAWDVSYGVAPSYNQEGCLLVMHVRLKRPAPLAVTFRVTKPVRCWMGSTGELTATVTGGIPLTPDSTKYNFTWYRIAAPYYGPMNVNDSVLRDIGPGQYMVEVSDKYNNVAQSGYFQVTAPLPLDGIVISSFTSCYNTPDGVIGIMVSGGTTPYSYEWSTGDHTPNVNGVAGGQYVVVVKDANGCQLTRQVTVTSPNRITTAVQITPVGCNGGSSGAIHLTPSGGYGGEAFPIGDPYSYLWSTGSTASSITNLPPGTYWYRVSTTTGCYDSDTITLDAPEPYTVTAGNDRKICIGQTIRLNAQISPTISPLTTTWSGPQGTVSGQTIQVNTPGTYIVTVTNATGCQQKDTVVVTQENATVNTSFTVSTQAFAGEQTTLVNISPLLQDSVIWILPPNPGITLISSTKAYCELKFSDTGHYTVGIRAYYLNGCIDEQYNDVNVVRKEGFVNTGNQSDGFLKQFSLYPNPTSGSFTLSLLFNDVTVARVRVINILTNVNVSDRMLMGAATYTEQFNIAAQPAGTYVVLIETPKGNFVHKLNKL
jgi:hypothetical protein